MNSFSLVSLPTSSPQIERLDRFCTAYQYSEALSTLAESDKELAKMKETIDAQAAKALELAGKIKEKEAAMEELSRKRGGDMSKAYNKAKDIEDSISKELVKLTAVWQNKGDAVKTEQKSLAAAKAAIGKGQKALEAKQGENVKVEAEFGEATANVQAKREALASVEQAYQNMCAGVESTEEAAGGGDAAGSMTLEGQVTKAKELASQADEAVKQGEMTAKHLTGTVKDLKKEAKAVGKESESLSNELSTAEKALAKLQGKLESVSGAGKASFDPKEQKALSAEKVSLEQQKSHCVQTIERLEAELAGRLAFEYKTPHKGFDKSKVKGLVARLVEVQEGGAATALEVVAGGKLYQVVVDDEITAKALLQKGALKRRVTIIPLNKVSRGGLIDDKKAAAAGKVAKDATGGTAARAIEFVGFDEEVRAAMEYAFGDKFVCDSLQTARATANHKDVQKKCVTMDGDLVDPSGTMTGGSSGSLGSCLSKLTQLGEAQKELGAAEERLAWLGKELTGMATGAAKFAELSEAVELKTQEVALLRERLSRTALGAVEARLAEAEASLAAATAKAAEAKAEGKAARAKLASLAKEEGKVRAAREAKLKSMEGKVKGAKKDVKDAEAKAKAVEKKLKLVKMEAAKLAEEAESADGSVAAIEEEIETLLEAVASAEGAAAEKRSEYDEAKAALDAAAAELSACDAEAKQLAKERDREAKQLTAAELEAKKLEGKVGRFNKDQSAARAFCDEIKAKHAWIAGEEKYFGQSNTDYDFEARDPKVAVRELKDLTKQQEALSKKINKKVMHMLEKAEQEYTELVNKRQTVESDKVKIQKVIAELDVKKNQALQVSQCVASPLFPPSSDM
jgi:structural maintenance of chromosome 2